MTRVRALPPRAWSLGGLHRKSTGGRAERLSRPAACRAGALRHFPLDATARGHSPTRNQPSLSFRTPAHAWVRLPVHSRYEARNKLALPFGQDVVSEFRVTFAVAPGEGAAAHVACCAGVHGNVPSFVRLALRSAALLQFQVRCPRAVLCSNVGKLDFNSLSRVWVDSPRALRACCVLSAACTGGGLQTTFRNMEALMREFVAEADAARGFAPPPPLPTERPLKRPWIYANVRQAPARRSGLRARAVDVAGAVALGAALAAAVGVAVAAAALAWLAAG